MQVQAEKRIYTPVEYLELEATAEYKSEYHDGERSLSSFKEYILIDQYQYYVEQFAKTTDNKWVLTEYQSATDVLAFSSLDFQINFSDIYHRVNFGISEI